MDTSNWDTLVVGGTILTMEPGSEPIPDGAIAVADGRIAAVGLAEDLLEHAPTGEVVNAGGLSRPARSRQHPLPPRHDPAPRSGR